MNRLRRCLVVAAVLAVTGCSAGEVPTARPAPSAARSAPVSARPSTPTPSSGTPAGAAPPVARGGPADPYADLARQLDARHVEVWFEADLVARWLEGPGAFGVAMDRLAALARVPGVQGFKVADELGYDDGIATAADATRFLQDVRAAMDERAPRAEVLIDMVVPELGCLAWVRQGSPSCARSARAEHPAATVSAVSGYLRAGLVDRLDLSTGLLEETTYRNWHLTPEQAQARAWARATGLGWGDEVTLQSRKALAEAGGYQGSETDAVHDTATFVDIPVEAGARAVDIWTWRQEYDGQTVGLLAEDLSGNPLWRELERRHRAGVTLITHMTPSLLPPGRDARTRQYDRVAEVFRAVLVAAGTG